MNNFFYDLNKRMADLGQKQTLSEGVVTERATGDYSAKKAAAGKDIGKPGKNFEKIAKSAGERYGSKAAGERVAGAVLNKLRGKNESQLDELSPDTIASYQKKAYPQATTTGPKSDQRTAGIVRSLGRPTKEGMEEGQLNELSPELLKRARDKAGEKWANADDRRDKKASDKYNRQDDKFNSALRKKQKGMDEAVRGLFYGDQGWQAPTNQAQRDLIAKNVKQKRAINRADTRVTGYGNRVEPQRGPESGTGAAGATVQRTQPSYGDQETPVNFKPSGTDVNPKHIDRGGNLQIKPGQGKGVAEEGGIPMTAKQKSFAALAPPKDKITFADKIAGAKQEVEEMLGDVAAEAIKSALSPKQKKLDRNNNGKLDAQDFEMLRKGGKQETDEGFDDMEKDVKRRLSTPKVGDVRRGARHDIETTATGIRATRRQDDETDDQPTGEKRRAGRPKGADKGPERVTGKAYKHKGGRKTNEGDIDITDRGEYDQEGDMAKDSIKTVVRHAQALEKILGDNDNLPEWVQSKLAKIESMMTAVDDYMQNQEDDRGDDMPMGEESTVKRDNRAERAGKKVAKDIEYDEKKKDKKVAETTTSGSVATGGDAPKASKGGMQVGKGIYDSLNRKVEGMIAESMSINVSMSTDDNGSHKNITVTAADEDAEMLAQLLRSAGLGGGMSPDHGHEEPCPACGSTDCGCDENMAEAYGDTDASQNEPNWPTDTEYSDDAMQYSGGLNGPKSTGQTTIPVIAHQGARTGVDDEELRRMMEMAGIKQQELKPWERTMKEAAVSEAMPAPDAQIDIQATNQYAEKIKQALQKTTNAKIVDVGNQDGTIKIVINPDPNDRNPPSRGYVVPDGKLGATIQNINAAIDPYENMFRSKGWRFDQMANGMFTIGVTKAQQPAVAEGVVDKVKDVVKKGLEKLGHGSDEDMRKDLQKKMGVPPTGEKPADKKMEESLMREFANFRI